MKKLFALSLAALAVSACAPSQVRAQNDATQIANAVALPGFDFTRPQNLAAFDSRRDIVSFQQTAEGLEVVANGGDPFFLMPPLELRAGEPLFLHLRAKSDNAGFFQVFYFPVGGGPNESNSLRINVVQPGTWQDYRVPMPRVSGATAFRFDLPGASGRSVISSFDFETQTQALNAALPTAPPQGRVLASDFQRLIIGTDGAILSWQVRRDAKQSWSKNLVRRLSFGRTTSLPPNAFPTSAWRWTTTKTSLIGTDDIGNRLRIELNGPQLIYALRPATREYSQGATTPNAKPNAPLSEVREGARLQIEMPFLAPGYTDRATGKNLKPDAPSVNDVTSFTSLLSGHIITVERLKRSAMPVEISDLHREYSQRKTQSLRLATRLGLDILLDGFSPQAPITFTPGFAALSVSQQMPPGKEHVLTARVQAASPVVQLENGKRIPRFSVSPDRKIRSASGSEYSLNGLLNDFYHETAFWWVSGNGGIWSDWTAIELGFADAPYRDNLRSALTTWIVGDDGYGRDGYAYTWGAQRGWPFPGGVDTRHLDSNAILITAAWRLYGWMGDKKFFTDTYDNAGSPSADQPTKPNLVPARDTLLNKMRRAMAYQLNWWNGAEEGIIHSTGKEGDTHHGGRGLQNDKIGGENTAAGVGSNYYDIMPFGGKDAYASVQFYLSLHAMAQVEDLFGNAARAKYLRDLMPKARAAFNANFWLEGKGNGDGASRYAGAIDNDGTVHDYGFTFLNTMAMDAGLASPQQAKAIYNWLDNGVSVAPNGEKKKDIYDKWKFGARSTTIFNRDWWAYQQGRWPWEDQLQNGGADLYEAGYDIIARARYLGADSAWNRYLAMLTRYAQPDRLSGGGVLWDGAKVQGGDSGAGSVGVMYSEFPEAGVASASFLYAFLGAQISADGLTLTPRVPTELQSVRAADIDFHGATFDLEASKTALQIRCTTNPKNATFLVNDKPQRGTFSVAVPLNASTRAVTLQEAARRNL